MSTKEECLEALHQMTRSCEGNEDFCLENCDACSVIRDLINEHFASSENRVETRDNPPLKFEWFRNKDNYYKPFYDSKEKEWHIFTMKVLNHERFFVDYRLRHMEFEENRFYEREIK